MLQGDQGRYTHNCYWTELPNRGSNGISDLVDASLMERVFKDSLQIRKMLIVAIETLTSHNAH